METTSTQTAQERIKELQDRVGPQVETALENLATLNRRATTFVKENPVTCLVGALALGYVIGKLASRR